MVAVKRANLNWTNVINYPSQACAALRKGHTYFCTRYYPPAVLKQGKSCLYFFVESGGSAAVSSHCLFGNCWPVPSILQRLSSSPWARNCLSNDIKSEGAISRSIPCFTLKYHQLNKLSAIYFLATCSFPMAIHFFLCNPGTFALHVGHVHSSQLNLRPQYGLHI